MQSTGIVIPHQDHPDRLMVNLPLLTSSGRRSSNTERAADESLLSGCTARLIVIVTATMTRTENEIFGTRRARNV